MWASRANATECLLQVAKSIFGKLPSEMFFSSSDLANGLHKLEGISVRFNIEKLGGPVGDFFPFFTLGVRNGEATFVDEHDTEPDVTMTGSVFDFLALLDSHSRGEPLSSGRIELTGDLAVVQEIQNILNNLALDPETWVASKWGDDFAHALSKVARLSGDKAELFCSKLESDLSEYLKYELQVLPRKLEVEQFRNDSFQLEDDLDRLDVRIENLNFTGRGR